MAASVDIFNLKETFYVPRFELKLAGAKPNQGILRDVMQVTYKDSVDDIDSFQLTINNWDGRALKPKYEPPSQDQFRGVFDPGKRVELRMGYGGQLKLMLTGEITSLEPDFPNSGNPTLSVHGLNVLHAFRTEQHTKSWEKRRDSDIAVELGNAPQQKGKPGLGIKVQTDPGNEQAETFVLMNNQYDIVFLLERARRHDYDLVLKQDDQGSSYLRFGPSETRREVPTYRLVWGRTLSSFHPTLSTARQISDVVVRGWDRHANKPIEESASWQDVVKDSKEKAKLITLAQAFGNRREIVTDRPVHSAAEAKALAKDILKNQLNLMVQASASCVGLPALRSGCKVEIAGFGQQPSRQGSLIGTPSRFDGIYYVTQSTHTIGENGYRTQFDARRDPTDQGSSAAPTGA